MEDIKTKREFKFRAWIFEAKKFDNYPQVQEFTPNFKYRKGEYELNQFTGLIDENGKDIYEGDILKHHGIVAWNDVEHIWSAIDLNWNDKREWHNIDYLSCSFIIIGNIYQNSDLLS